MGVNQFQAAEVLNLTGPEVEMTVGRDPEPGEDQVFQIIQQTNSAIEEQTPDSQEESPRNSINDLMPTDDGKKLFCLDLEEVNVSMSAAQADQKPEEDNLPSTLALEGVQKLSENISICDVNDLLEDDAEELDKASDEEGGQERPSDEPQETKDPGKDSNRKNLVKTSVIMPDQENIPTISQLAGSDCCPYKNKYESLLERLEKSDNLARQLSSNLKTVRSELLSRDQTIQLYVENVEKLINKVKYRYVYFQTFLISNDNDY